MTAERKFARLEEFERAVYLRATENRDEQNAKAFALMSESLGALREGAGFGPNNMISPALLTRMASAIIALLGDPTFNCTEDQFAQLCVDRNVIDTLFQASPYGNSDHIFGLVDENTPSPNKLLPLSSINTPVNVDWQAIFSKYPEQTLGLWLSLIGYGQVFTETADIRREKLLALAPIFEKVNVHPQFLNIMTGAYMHCSYGHSEDKHSAKRVMHQIIRNTVQVNELPQNIKRRRKARPTILVCHEWWHRQHAMYRSYARSIDQLRERFEVIGMSHEQVTDIESRKHFNSWISIGGKSVVLSEVAAKIRNVDPDIIYYPSIGMTIWVIAMASFRLAPIQIMSYGHPATSNSPMIDYGIIEEDTFNADRFSEKIITLPANTVRPTEFEKVTVKHMPRKTDVIRIGIAAMQVKVSWPFVCAMQEVAKRAEKKIEFWFFSACHGIGLYSFANEMGKLLPNITAQQAQPYSEYLASLAQCDLALFSFPFGGTNSMIDAMSIGLPMVTLLGEEPHSMSDTALVRRAGLPESLVCKTMADYVLAVLRLQNDEYRALVAELVREVDVGKRFFQADEGKTFLKTFEKIYQENTVNDRNRRQDVPSSRKRSRSRVRSDRKLISHLSSNGPDGGGSTPGGLGEAIPQRHSEPARELEVDALDIHGQYSSVG